MYGFDYLRAATLDEAGRALKTHPGAKLLAGGQTLIPSLRLRLNRTDLIIDLGAIAGLNAIELRGDTLAIAAMTTHAEIAASPAVQSSLPGLVGLAEDIGDPQVRNRGTIGGSIANNDPAADYPAAVVALNATVTTNTGKHTADAFFKGLFETALGEGELVTSVSFPKAE